MKSLMTLTVLALASSSAMALDTTMDAKGRFDYVKTKSEVKNTTTTKTSTGEYKISNLTLGAATKFNETTKFRLVLDLTDSNTAVTNSVSEFVDEAVLTKTFGNFAFMVGKQVVLSGGRENDWSKRDLYLTSGYYASLPNNLIGLTGSYTYMD